MTVVADQRRRVSRAVAARRPRFRYTARAAVLVLVLCALAVTLAYPMRQYVSQRAQINQLRKQNEQRQQVVDTLQQQVARWNDPDYVRIQARIRLHMVLPGETGYVLLHK
jgi:cell division protein FtsB